MKKKTDVILSLCQDQVEESERTDDGEVVRQEMSMEEDVELAEQYDAFNQSPFGEGGSKKRKKEGSGKSRSKKPQNGEGKPLELSAKALQKFKQELTSTLVTEATDRVREVLANPHDPANKCPFSEETIKVLQAFVAWREWYVPKGQLPGVPDPRNKEAVAPEEWFMEESFSVFASACFWAVPKAFGLPDPNDKPEGGQTTKRIKLR